MKFKLSFLIELCRNYSRLQHFQLVYFDILCIILDKHDVTEKCCGMLLTDWHNGTDSNISDSGHTQITD